ncbi:MAG: hypothetical protein NC095_11530 [Muribaculum sp.]|nr:hypothetical protein [Muribaculum sp.]
MKKLFVLMVLIQFSVSIVATTRYPILSITVPLVELTDSAVKADIFDPVVDYIDRKCGKTQYQKLGVNIVPMVKPDWRMYAHGFSIWHIEGDMVKYNFASYVCGAYIQNGCVFMIGGDYERYFKAAHPRKNVTIKLFWNRDMDDEEDPDLWAYVDYHSLGDKKRYYSIREYCT